MRLLVGLFCFPALWYLQARPGVERALDKVVVLEQVEAPLTQACGELARQAGVQITLDPETLDVLPYGGDTKVSATFRNVTLRHALTQLLAPLCMRFEVTDQGIVAYAHSALLRLGRRASWQTLDTLRELQGIDWRYAKSSEAFKSRFQFRVSSQAPWTELQGALVAVGAAPGDVALTEACRTKGWTWFPQNDQIIVLPDREQMQRLLRSRVSLRCAHRPLVEALQQLARKARVPIRLDPAAAAALPRQTRDNFSLLAERIVVNEALDQIAAATGLTYRLGSDGVVFSHPDIGPHPMQATVATTAPAASDPYVAKLVLPAEPGGLQLEILIRQSELSPEANEARKKLIKQADEIFVLELNRRAAND